MSAAGPARRRLLSSILRDALRADPRLALSVTGMRLTAAVLTPLDAVALGLLIDAGVRGDVAAALGWAALFALCDAGSSALNHPASKLEMTLREKTNFLLERRLLRLSTAHATLEHLERPEYHDRLELARDRSSSLGDLVVRVIALAQAAVLMSVVLIALVSVHWVLLALVAAAIPTVYLAGRGELARSRGNERAVSALRLADRLFDLSTRATQAKDVKVHGAEPMVYDRFGAATRAARGAVERAEVRAVTLTAAGWLLFAVAFVAAVTFVVRDAVEGRASTGQVLIVFALAIRLNEQVEELTGALAGVRRAAVDVSRLLWLYEASVVTVRPPAPPSGSGSGSGIVLEGVSFRYPSTDVDVLRDVDLRLPAGTTVALVGDNGAGKTTLVKLLCGLYEPTAGRIAVDGVDLTASDRVAWRGRLSAAFQDFVRFELLAREAVGLGRVERMEHDEDLWAAIERAGARDTIDGLPHRLRTQLGGQWPNGVDLSLGQWQKVALARAMMRTYPALLVLDEPSASLDTAAEHALYERFSRASKFGAATSAVTLLVSHRFSTVRMADQIVLLHEGRIREVGSHSELIRLGGLYAELYELQARGYR
ncbi:ABC transporter ATP-binding protein [Micromonospora tulbaghiae]|uniref:ABC transporter ATP-binding protein n=1 Tax=Micromonospora tulbaghiae TaxID=479978 RepID=UPI0033D5FF98